MNRSRSVVVGCISVILLCSSCSSVIRKLESKQITGILGAFEQEVTILEGKLAEGRGEKIEEIKFVSGKLDEKNVVLAWTGIGTVNAAMTTTLMYRAF